MNTKTEATGKDNSPPFIENCFHCQRPTLVWSDLPRLCPECAEGFKSAKKGTGSHSKTSTL